MSPLSSEIDALPAVIQPRCRTCRWLAEQDTAAQEAFWRYVDRVNPEDPSYRPLYTLCTRNGLDVHDKSFRDHCRSHKGKQ